MTGTAHLYDRTRSVGQPGHKQLFLLVVALGCLAGFHAFGRRDVARIRVERASIATHAPIAGYARIVDGDTIRVAGVPIRLEGLDAPERDQPCTDQNGTSWPCGQAATRQLRERIGGRRVTCAPRAIDRYGRVVATCAQTDGATLNAWLVRQGWAIASGFTYADEEAAAKADKRGIWSGTFVTPRDWRRRKGHSLWHRLGFPDR